MKPNVDLGTVQKTVNSDQTLNVTTAIPQFSTLLNSKSVYTFKQAFPGIDSERLERVYYIEFAENEQVQEFSQRQEIENFILLERPELTFDLPNDYIEVSTEIGGTDYFCNTALELINAPLAWTVTQGDPNVLVGIVDSKFDLNHPDLQGRVSINLNDAINQPFHGTGVANTVAGNTNNGVGISSLANQVKLVTADRYWDPMRVWEVANIPGVKVINCSFAGLGNNSITEELYTAIHNQKNVLVVAAAGNHDSTTYRYPAAYPTTLSATSVGSRFDVGEINSFNQFTNSWKDVHNFRNTVPGGPQAHTHNDRVDVCAPGQYVQIAGDDYFNPAKPNGYFLGRGTSQTAPYVSALAALIFSVDPNFTAQQVKDIIKDTADGIYHIPSNQAYLGQLGTGRINAFHAVKKAYCMVNPANQLDLAMQNSKIDGFVEPDIDTEYVWHSKDIWVRNQDDGNIIKNHQNPEYSTTTPNYAYVRVTNNSCKTNDSGVHNLKLYWSKANTELTWPLHWDGSLTIYDDVTNTDVLMGDLISTQQIPVLEPGESTIIKFPWLVPNPDDYENINSNKWHFCLLARIESQADPMTFTEGTAITDNVKNNNNIAWKNTTVVDVISGIAGDISGVIGAGNSTLNTRTSYFEFITDTIANVTPLYEAAEILVEMDNKLYDAWDTGGSAATNFKSTKLPNNKIVQDQKATLDNVIFPANTIATMNISFNFLTDKKDNKMHYIFHVVQRDASTDEIIGGETYIINKYPRPTFQAEAGGDKEIEKDESVTITAAQINEAAVYNWYDPDGNLVFTGQDLTVTPEVTKTYTLEIISDSDGYKDYDEVEVKVNPYKIESLVPNPSSNLVTINYEADEAVSVYLMVVGTQNNTSNNYILNSQETSMTLDVSTFENGIYAVALVCDGVIVASKNLYKN